MEFITALGIQSPFILATLFLLVASLLKLGREKGAILCVLGAVGLVVMSIANPIVYSLVIPRIMEDTDQENIKGIFQLVGILTTLAWAVSITLFGLGTISRSAGRESRPS